MDFANRRRVRTAGLALSIALALAAVPAHAQDGSDSRPVTAIIVRHADRAPTDPTDPPLDSAGALRATALYEAIRDAGVSAIYVTPYRRARETAAPTAAALGIAPRELSPGRDVPVHAREIAATLLERHRGEVVLVVGHSNTIGPIVRALGALAPERLEDNDYDNLYIVTADGTSPARIVRARYGAPDPAP